LHTQQIHYREGDADLTGELVLGDTSSARRPGVIVIHGGAGLDLHARTQAARFANAGYLAFACDMYGAGVAGNRERVMATINGFRSDRQRAAQRVGAAVDLLRAQPQMDGRLAVVGYCFGGLISLELARSGLDARAIVSVHGTLTTTQPVESGAITAAILVCQGGSDPHCPISAVTTFANEMNAGGVDWQMEIYGKAVHGFTHEDATGQMPGVRYDADADARSFAAICTFLQIAFL
jgi:dienelactone hydrolase